MAHLAIAATPPMETMTDEEVVTRVLAGEVELFEVIMRRYNQRIYRAARAITRDDSKAEDIMQAAYVRAYEHLRQFSGAAPFGAWLTRIAVNEALARLRNAKRFDQPEGEGDHMDRFASPAPNPEQAAANSEASHLLESLVEHLPDGNRAVFVLRDVEGMSTAETSHALGITEENVKVRLHRARATLRVGLSAYATREARDVFAFHARRCDRIVKNVFDQILKSDPPQTKV
ncbi:MAG: RNA polymerase sigma factor [Granulicella sp.]